MQEQIFGPYGMETHGRARRRFSTLLDHLPREAPGVLLMSNSDNAESIFDHLLRVTVADPYTPLEWHGYVPYDRKTAQTGGKPLAAALDF
jgi:serine-type D-Ala-D-Ala carboxypeptidase/endopeptidase